MRDLRIIHIVIVTVQTVRTLAHHRSFVRIVVVVVVVYTMRISSHECRVVSCHVMSCHVMSCHLMSCHMSSHVPIVRRSSMEESHMNLTKFIYGKRSLEGDITIPFNSTLRCIASSDSDIVF